MSLASHPLVKKLEEKFLPEFEKVAAKIREDFPNVSVRVYASESGSLTEFQGYNFWIECSFKDKFEGENDDVYFGVDLCHVTTVPKISADVSWGNSVGLYRS